MYVHILYTNVGRYVGRQVGGLAQAFEIAPETASRVLRFETLSVTSCISLEVSEGKDGACSIQVIEGRQVLGMDEDSWSLLIPV